MNGEDWTKAGKLADLLCHLATDGRYYKVEWLHISQDDPGEVRIKEFDRNRVFQKTYNIQDATVLLAEQLYNMIDVVADAVKFLRESL